MWFDFLPPEYRKHAFIAGGWAACPALATDMDVWVTIPHDNVDPSVDSESKRASESLSFYTKALELKEFLRTRDVFYTFNDMHGGTESYPSGTFKLCELEYPWKKIDVMVTTDEAEDVIEGFDISSHQVAIKANGEVVKGSKYTAPHETPVYVHKHSGSSHDRMQKIKQRYGHLPSKSFFKSLTDYVGA